MGNFFRAFIRISAFLRKEIFEVLRQPRLIVTLVLGPFLILAIFGAGYQNKPRTLRTLFVAPAGSQIAKDIQQYAPTLGPQLEYEGVISDKQQALNELRNRQIDLVVVAPDNAYQQILNNQQATFELYDREINPVEVDYVTYFGQFYVDVVNRRVVKAMAAQGQADAATLQGYLKNAQQSTNAARAAVASNNQAAARQHEQELATNINSLTLAMGAGLGLMTGIQNNVGGGSNSSSNLLGAINDLQSNYKQLNQSNQTGNKTAELKNLDAINQNLSTLNNQINEFRSISPDVIVSPFTSDVHSIAPIKPTATDFFAPAVLALLLQHLAVTFAALSIVRERIWGTMELFRVSPLSAGEALIGKFLSYMIFGVLIAAVLIGLLVITLHVPMIGNWLYFTVVVVGVLFTSLAIGFVISIVSQTDSQAVQYAMIILLASVFFSGFIITLDMLLPPVQIVSWLLPTTYGALMLRDIMLRGLAPSWIYLVGLYALGIVLTIIAWVLLRRLINIGQK